LKECDQVLARLAQTCELQADKADCRLTREAIAECFAKIKELFN
jgi:hypothetical protein